MESWRKPDLLKGQVDRSLDHRFSPASGSATARLPPLMDGLYPPHVIVRLLIGRDAALAFHRALARMIVGQRQRHMAVKAIQQPVQVAGTTGDVVGRVPRSGHTEPFGSLRYQRHPAPRALGAARFFSARRFGQGDRLHPQRPALRASVGS